MFLIGEFIDWFGKDFTVIRRAEDPEGMAEISVMANENAVFFWALQYEDSARRMGQSSCSAGAR